MLDKKYRKYKKPGFFSRVFSFSGRMERGEFWSELAVRVISFLCASILLCILIVLVVPGDTEQLTEIVDIAVPVLGCLWGISIIAMTRRRLRDAGYTAKSYLWLLLPGIGLIVLIARLCGESK